MVRYHEWAQQFVRNIQQETAWTWGAAAGVTILLAGLGALLINRVRREHDKGRRTSIIFLWSATLLFMAISQWMLMSVHTEAVHFIQYGILGVLVFFIVRRIPATLIITTVIGMVDEGYQYWVLYKGWVSFFDLNDIILNAVAAGLALLYLLSVSPHLFADETDDPWIVRNVDLLVLLVLAVLLGAGLITHTIALYRPPDLDPESVLLILNRNPPPTEFWFDAWWSGRRYHSLSPINGFLVLAAVLHFYRWALPRLKVSPRA